MPWIANPHTVDVSSYENDELLLPDGVTDTDAAVARIEDFGYAIYPCALNAKTGNIERGGAFDNVAKAKAWCERVAGFSPPKPGGERPPFYYRNDSEAAPGIEETGNG